jgi:hypothetical protein
MKGGNRGEDRLIVRLEAVVRSAESRFGDGATGKTDSHCALPVGDAVRGVPPLLPLLLRAGGAGSSVSGR